MQAVKCRMDCTHADAMDNCNIILHAVCYANAVVYADIRSHLGVGAVVLQCKHEDVRVMLILGHATLQVGTGNLAVMTSRNAASVLPFVLRCVASETISVRFQLLLRLIRWNLCSVVFTATQYRGCCLCTQAQALLLHVCCMVVLL